VLTLLVAVGALTALVAGIAGAWSPCGFSMVDTIGTALGDARRGVMIFATASFTVGAVAGGVATFGGLALLGGLLGHGAAGLRDALAGALALAAALADWRGWRIAPQIRRQVPERWRWIMPLPLACGLYGLLLGLGFTTFVLSFAVWALAGISFAADSAIFGVVIGAAFGVGRALPVLWIAPRLGTERGDLALDRLALEPRLWLGLRRLDAIGLGACAALLAGSGALAAGANFATDPSAYGGSLAWQAVGGRGWLYTHSKTMELPGRLPALGGGNLAYVSRAKIVVAPGITSDSPKTIPGPARGKVDALAVSAHWLVVRDATASGIENLFALSLRDAAKRRYLAGSATPGAIGRPTVEASTVVWSYSNAHHSGIYQENLSTGVRTVLRLAAANVQYANPALDEGRLLYERTDRCSQELLLGLPSIPTAGRDRVLLSLPSTVLRDPGYQPGYIQDYNSASLCKNRPTGPGGTTTLGSTALSGGTAYVSESAANVAHTTIVTVGLGASASGSARAATRPSTRAATRPSIRASTRAANRPSARPPTRAATTASTPPSRCAPRVSTIDGRRAIAYCGPATVLIQIGGRSYRFTDGLCDRSETVGALEVSVGTLVRGATGNAGLPFVSLVIGKSPSESEALEADSGGRQLFGDTVIGPAGTLLGEGTFTSLYGVSFSGSWNCHGVIYAGP
jgi:hypothetical protein